MRIKVAMISAMLVFIPVVYAGPEVLTVTVDFSKTAQTIEGFGASDCWSGQFVGNWPAEKVAAISDLLFSTQTKPDGSPAGIGLSIWRFNLGGGSSRQHNIFDSWRAADCLLDMENASDGRTGLGGQVNLLQAAKARGVSHFIAFVNSPPYSMTKNGNAFCDPASGTTNLRPDKQKDFAAYLADTLEYFYDHQQIEFKSVSPVNEPQWDWDENARRKGFATQEGCRYSNADIAALIRVLADELTSRKLGTVIDITEAGDIVYLFGSGKEKSKYGNSSWQISAFFDPNSPEYIGDKVGNNICGHSYWSDGPARLVADRQALRQQLDKFKLNYAQTEYSIIGEQPGMSGPGRDLGISPALWLARVIHFDMTIANAVSWSWWLAISPYNYKDGLVYCEKKEDDGEIYQSKMLWALGNYSRFVRPGMKRLELARSDSKTDMETVDGLMVSGYYSAVSGQVVLVLVNFGQQEQAVKVQLVNKPEEIKVEKWQPYVTSGDDPLMGNLAPGEQIKADRELNIAPRSIVTITSN